MVNMIPSGLRRRAFTFIEMLVVLVIIAILAGIVISLAQRVSHGGKHAATKNVLQAAESMLTDYISRREAEPPMFVRTNQTTSATGDPERPDLDEEYMFPLIDGRYEGRSFPPQTGGPAPRFDKDRDPPQPAAALLLLEMVKESPEVERALQGIDPRFLQRRDMYAFGWRVDPMTNQPTGSLVLRKLRIPQLLDAYGNPIRYVHPAFQGGYGNYYNNNTPPTVNNRKYLELSVTGQNGRPVVAVFSRSYRPFGPNVVATDPIGDADEGLAIGGHGYFYSPGADADPGTRQDNVYNRKPSFPPETANLQ